MEWGEEKINDMTHVELTRIFIKGSFFLSNHEVGSGEVWEVQITKKPIEGVKGPTFLSDPKAGRLGEVFEEHDGIEQQAVRGRHVVQFSLGP